MESIPLNAFITSTITRQSKKSPGGYKMVWTDKEEADMKLIAEQVLIASYSQAEALNNFKAMHKAGRTVGAIRPNKTPTAFRDKLKAMVDAGKTEVVDERGI